MDSDDDDNTRIMHHSCPLRIRALKDTEAMLTPPHLMESVSSDISLPVRATIVNRQLPVLMNHRLKPTKKQEFDGFVYLHQSCSFV